MSNDGIVLYFYPKPHEYKDNYKRRYTSCTQVIDAFTEKKDWLEIAKNCEVAGKNPSNPKYPKYAGWTAEALLEKWAKDTNASLILGNNRHDMLDNSIKESNNFNYVYNKLNSKSREPFKLVTIRDVMNDPRIGRVDIEVLRQQPLCKYEDIYELIVRLHDEGYKFYSEIGVYHSEYLISGLVDLVAIKGDTFIIIDWKTNRDIIKFESGYFDKDENGLVTDHFINTWENFRYPIDYVPASVGHKYTLQLSGYSYQLEQFGLKNQLNILCHIRRYDPNDESKEKVDLYNINYMKDEVISMYSCYSKWRNYDRTSQVA